MGDDLASANEPEHHRDIGDATEIGIPSPRSSLDDTIENLAELGSDDLVWWYDQPRKRGSDRRYWGQVERVGGPEGDQLRENLAAVIRDLLNWARQQADTEPDRDSHEDGGTDDTPR
ncbi:hypothetical protein [Actinophytocola sp.]|uniref:hypothetical protein n=1 Tax=Actinophytocola sp. TaxID=1872138 RepID=UPI003D6AF03D